MKKILIMLCSVFLFASCTSKNSENSVIQVTTEEMTETVTKNQTESETVSYVTEISDNIKLYDLTQAENKEYLQYPDQFSYGKEYEMADHGKIIEEKGNIYLENVSGERTALIKLPVESETVYVVVSCIIDSSRFAYNIIQEDLSLGCGIYNLANGDDYRIEGEDRCYYFPEKVLGDHLILTRGFIGDFYGYSKLDLKTFELTDIDFDVIENKHYRPCTAFSSDMKIAANISADYSDSKNYEYTVTLFSLENEKVIDEYKITSKDMYINFYLKFVSDNQLYVYAYKKDDVGSNYMYAIDILPILELNEWQKAYKHALFDFKDSDKYFSGSKILLKSGFSLYDLNTDGIPELIISENSSHAAGCYIYTYGNGIIYLGKYGAFGDLGFYEDNGTIHSYNIAQGFEYDSFYKLENNEMNPIAKFFNDAGAMEQATFKFNDNEIPRNEYSTKLAEYKGNEYIPIGRDYDFDEIDAALTEYSRKISISRASEMLWNSLEKYGGRRIVYQDRQKFDDKPYYIFRSFEDYDDRRVTTGWYAVDIITGECYDTHGLTELTPLINEEKKFSCKVTESGGVEVYSDGKFYQSLDVKIDDVILHRQSKNLMFMDYNFDGYNDIAVDTGFATNRVCSYFRYNPDTEYFEKWEELDNLHFYIHVNEDKTLYVHSKSGAVDTDDTVYKWLGDVLTPVSREKRYSKGKDIIKDYFEYDSKGNEILAKREKYIFDENGKITDTVNVPLQ
ncbi:MAG TPA: hypothetical protein RWO09_01165 [Ruminococcus sp.]